MRLELTFAEWMGLLTTVGILVTFGLSLYRWLQHDRPRRSVKVDFVDHPQREKGEVIGITFINERGQTVAIEEAGFEYADGSRKPRPQLLGSISTSVKVFPGRKHTYYYGLWEWRNDIREGEPVPVKAYCRDATGHCYTTLLSPAIRSALFRREMEDEQ